MARCLSHYQSDNGNQYWKFDMRTLDSGVGLEQDIVMTRYRSPCPMSHTFTWILEYGIEMSQVSLCGGDIHNGKI